MVVRRKRGSTSNKFVITLFIISLLLIFWAIFVVCKFAALRSEPKVVEYVNEPKLVSENFTKKQVKYNSTEKKEHHVAYDKDYLKITGEMRSGKVNMFGTPSERNLLNSSFDIVLNIKNFNAKSENDELESMMTMFFVRSIEKYFVPFNLSGKIYVLVQAKNRTFFPNWHNGRLNIVGYEEIFPSPENNLPVANLNAVEANLRSIPGISNNFFFFNKFTYLKDYVSISNYLTLDGKIKVCKYK